MYNTQMECTYNTEGVFLETDVLTDDEKIFVRDAIYRQEMLNIFKMEEYNEDIMNYRIHLLYELVKDCCQINSIMEYLSEYYTDSGDVTFDEEFGLTILYAYDYMDLTHVCVSEYLLHGTVNETHISNLKNKVGI